ncbi:SCO family protein [Metabacillus sp. 113a]|uniref:SCO family protein n=1 Tax=Metabacillus sp. 113a TaxID=3404706 RepID=UPI003CECDE06
MWVPLNKAGVIWIAVLVVLISGCARASSGYSSISSVEDFEYTDQEGRPFGLEELKGSVWIADFIFTSCETVCPPMTAHMKKFQDMADEEKIPVEIVSFSVDPEVDSPSRLKEFGQKSGTSFQNWHFLTGYSQEEIEDFSLKSFKALVKKPENEDQVIHGTSFYLIDKEGEVVKTYSGIEKTPYKEILDDAKRLQQQ